MASVYDIMVDNDSGDILEKNGDFVIGESTLQHQKTLLLSNEGEFKQSPLSGVGALNFIDDEGPENFMRKIRRQFTSDGMDVVMLNMDDNGKLITKAAYK